MKITKYNEASNAEKQQEELDTFIENFVEYFNMDLDDLGPYSCIFDKKKIKLLFQYQQIDPIDINKIGKVFNYIKSLDSIASMIWYPENDKELQWITVDIKISLTGYPKIYDDLELKLNSTKFNV